MAGFPVASTGQTFPGLRDDQIGFGLPAAVSAGNGYTAPVAVHQALDCLVKGQNCGGYTLRGGTSPAFRGLMTWSINWDRYYNWEFQNSHAPYLATLPGDRRSAGATVPRITGLAGPGPCPAPTDRAGACGLPIPVEVVSDGPSPTARHSARHLAALEQRPR